MGLVGLVSMAPIARAETDLSLLLAAPPSTDWIESGLDPSLLVGPVTAQSYSSWANDNGASERALQRYGFVGGYGRNWVQGTTQDALAEWVLQFSGSAGATYWFNDLRLFDETSKDWKRDIPSITGSQSVGVEDDFSDGSREYTIEFAKGNLFFDVTMDADTTDLAATTRRQAQSEYEAAPAGGVAVPPHSQPPWAWIGLAVAAALLMSCSCAMRVSTTFRRAVALAG